MPRALAIALGKDFFKNPENFFAEGQGAGPRQRFFKKNFKKKLFLCRGPALSKQIFFKKKTFAEGPGNSPRQRFFWKNPENFFAEGQGGGPRQRFLKKIKKIICRGPALDKKNSKKTISLPRVGPRHRNRQRRRRVTASFLCRGPSWPSAKTPSPSKNSPRGLCRGQPSAKPLPRVSGPLPRARGPRQSMRLQ